MARLQDVQSRALRELLGTFCKSRSLVNLQNATATFDSITEPDSQINVSIAGGSFSFADVTDKALATLAALQNPVTGNDGYYDQPKSTTVYYLWVKNAAGTDYVIQGTYAGQVLGYGFPRGPKGDGSIPDIAVPDTYVPIAVFKVVNGTTAVWVPGTTNWNAAGVTASAAPVTILTSDPSKLTFVAGGA
jgi:hypothetical protein